MSPQKKTAAGLKNFKKQLADKSLGTLYIFHGEEDYLREYYLDAMRDQLVPQGMEEFNLHTFEGDRATPQALDDAISALPMMSERSMVVVRDLDLFSGDAKKKENLESLLTDLPEYVCVVFVYDILPYKPDARQRMAKFLAANAQVVEFPRQEQGDLVAWIKRRFAALDHTVDTQLAEYLIFLCGNGMTGLISEIEKVGAYARERAVTRADIDAVATPVLDAVLYDMTDAVRDKRFDKAMEILRDLFAMKFDPIMLLASLGRQFRQLYSARLLLERRGGERQLQELWGLRSSYPAQRLMRAARGLSLEWCRRAVELCCDTDLKLKSAPGDRQRMLELMLLELAGEAGK